MGRDFWLENVTRKEKKSSKGPLIYYVISEWALLEMGYQNMGFIYVVPVESFG